MTLRTFPEIPGVELYLCGGAVRDEILGLPYKDRDYVVMTAMTFDELVDTICNLPGGQVFLEKPEFLTIRCMINKEAIDLVFPRGEGGYEDSRHPTAVARLDSLQEDAARRDLTMNAMYMDKNGTLIDFYNGKEDIENKIVRAVGNPTERFREDALRILRALRFSLRFGFEIEENTYKAMFWHSPLLNLISADRIREEINMCLSHDGENTFNLITKLGLWPVFRKTNIRFEATQSSY